MTTENCSSTMSRLESAERPFFLFGFTVSAVGATILNGFVLLLFIGDRSLRTFSNKFFISLVVSDILVGVILSPVSIAQIALSQERQSCILNRFAAVLVNLLGITAFTVAAIAFDRYQHITKPVLYQAYMTRWKKILLLGFPWFVPFILTPTRFLGEEAYSWTVLLLYVLLYSILITSYLQLVRFLWRRPDELIRNGNASPSTGLNALWKQNQKATRLICLVIISFIICTLGTFTYRLLMVVHFYRDDGLSFFVDHEPLIMAIGQLFFQLNSTLNPIIYFAKHSEIKRTIRGMPCCDSRNRVRPSHQVLSEPLQDSNKQTTAHSHTGAFTVSSLAQTSTART